MGGSNKFWQMAEDFVALVHKESGCPVIVCDERGVIRCSSDRTRIGNSHAGSEKIMASELEEVFVTAEQALENPLVKEGYSCLVRSGTKKIGTFGLAGNLEVVKPLARISSLVMSSWINELDQKEKIDLTSQKVFASADLMTDQNRDLSLRSKKIFQDIENAAKQATENVQVTDEILKTIQDISSRSNILSINGAIEAARSGEKGRAFAVVAQEMREMAKGTKEAAFTIEENLERINQSICVLNQTVESFSKISAQQYDMIDATLGVINEFKSSLLELKQG